MPPHRGRRLALSPQRRWIVDLLHASRDIPLVTVEREIDLTSLTTLRTKLPLRLGWVAIFCKAYALVALRIPELRRTYLKFPWPYLYEHPSSVATITVEREYLGEQAVFLTPIKNPETMKLLDIENRIRERKTGEISQFGEYRRLIRNSRWPRLVRRILWWGLLNLSGPARARYVGTFGLTVIASLGSSPIGIIAPMTTLLTYSPIDDQGKIRVRLSFDHRVMDGAVIARALNQLEQVLVGPIRDEMIQLSESVG
jgi:hypothetical protein